MTSSPVVPAQFTLCLSQARNVAMCYMCRDGPVPNFVEQVNSNVQDIDAMYVTSWENWFHKLSHGMPMSRMTPGDEDEAKGDGEGESGRGQPMDPPPPR